MTRSGRSLNGKKRMRQPGQEPEWKEQDASVQTEILTAAVYDRSDMQGKIIKGIGGFYYVYTEEMGICECRARGIFRKEKRKPLPGDNVTISILDETKKEGSLDGIGERSNELIRPAVANIDQVLLVFAAADPQPNFNLLDRFLISMNRQDIPVIICFNKADLVRPEKLREYTEGYRDCGCRVLSASVKNRQGLEQIRDLLLDRTTVVAGPSGVGKSSLTNYLNPEADMEVGEISRKIGRGKQTTRHTELIRIAPDSYFIDTPGFSSLFLQDLQPEQLKDCYPEFEPFAGRCRFQGCMHISEPDCAVKQAVEKGEISRMRYDSYVFLAQELKDQRRY